MAVSGEHRPPGELASGAPFLSLKLHVLIGILALCALSVALLVYLCVRLGRASKKRRALGKNSSGLIPLLSKEIVEIGAVDRADRCGGGAGKVEIVVVVELKGEKKRGDAEIASGSGDERKNSGENSRPKARVSNIEDDSRDKRIKGCPEEVESKISEQSNNKTNNNSNNNNKEEASASSSKENSKVSDVPKPDYIHVRARRGQATDSHSLAERARREKISERMKFLQDLVPGCNKVTGKALMLDEIINYVQSLQRQVEFLSTKLGAVNPRLDPDLDNIFTKEMIPACTASFPTTDILSDITNPAYLPFIPTQTVVSCSGMEIGINPDLGLRRTIGAPLSIPDAFVDSSCFAQLQQPLTGDLGLQSPYNMEFHQGKTMAFPSQQLTGSVEGNNLKMEK